MIDYILPWIFGIIMVVGILGLGFMLYQISTVHVPYRQSLYQKCLNDKVPEYECYGIIYGGRR